MPRSLIAAVTLLVLSVTAVAQPVPVPARPVRVGNVNLLTAGGGAAEFDHENFDSGAYPAITYQRRVLRREIRPVPIWLRAAFQYQSDDARFHGYTVWNESDEMPFPERQDGSPGVDERTRDIAVRFEALGDFLHAPWWAIYAGGGFVMHSLHFTSDGVESGIPTFEASLTETSPSALAGLRVFSPTLPYTGYVEVRYGRAFGKTSDTKTKAWLTEVTFDFTGVNALFVEGGVGFHW